jgi:hypothetical protein
VASGPHIEGQCSQGDAEEQVNVNASTTGSCKCVVFVVYLGGAIREKQWAQFLEEPNHKEMMWGCWDIFSSLTRVKIGVSMAEDAVNVAIKSGSLQPTNGCITRILFVSLSSFE